LFPVSPPRCVLAPVMSALGRVMPRSRRAQLLVRLRAAHACVLVVIAVAVDHPPARRSKSVLRA
jgi:hypothetical protein